jgi:hypothetical protein
VRKLWSAGAVVASGFLLFAAAPADADMQPAAAHSGAPADSLDRSTESLIGGALPGTGLPTVPSGGVPNVTGMPGGGMIVLAPAVADPAVIPTTAPVASPTVAAVKHKVKPAATPAVHPTVTPAARPTVAAVKHKHKVKPAATTSAPSTVPADPRLHEEPVDD